MEKENKGVGRVQKKELAPLRSQRAVVAAGGFAGKVFKQKSLAVPGEALSIQELFKRSVNGTLVPGRSELGFDSLASFDREDLEKLSMKDLQERQEFIDGLFGHMAVQQRQLAEQEKKKKEELDAEVVKLEEMKQMYADFKAGKFVQKDPLATSTK